MRLSISFLPMPCVRIGSASTSLIGKPRVERGQRVLEYDLQVAAHACGARRR